MYTRIYIISTIINPLNHFQNMYYILNRNQSLKMIKIKIIKMSDLM